MLDYITAEIAAENWGISKRRVQVLCAEGRVDGAIKHGGVWAIPISANKPDALKPGKKGD
ncbi:DNA-binding protein [Clostridium algidicarnis]|uniref:DNA-binding protein n=1 Tax=Clostridium algidicarnis TaxID=37659 RepID=UPI001CF17765|nr:DNA-binding protein [Clostridium algidicarnis]MCB2286904.1 DNA-binding protein [Clostridium algidicarnis]